MNSNDLQKKFQTLNEWQLLLLDEIREEYVKGMLALNSVPTETVTFYGGAKIQEGSKIYQKTKSLAKLFSERNWGVVSGGGPGIMQASLEGAKEGGGKAVAFKIDIPQESTRSENDVEILFKHFSVRKYMLRQSDVFVYCPGGYGTLDELMENVTLTVTKKHPIKPIFLLDSSFWKGYLDWFNKILLDEWHTINMDFKEMFHIVDEPEEVIEILYC